MNLHHSSQIAKDLAIVLAYMIAILVLAFPFVLGLVILINSF